MGSLEEVVVTATLRAENLQEVSISVVAISGEELELRGVQRFEQLSATVPNLNIISGLAGTTTPSLTVRDIPGVGLYFDGIWQVSNNGLLTQNLVELERVEVLRGPQGMLPTRTI